MAAGTLSGLKAAALAAGFTVVKAIATAPNAGAAQTSFTLPVDRLRKDDVVTLLPISSQAAALTSVRATVTSNGIVTVSHASAALAGTETFNLIAVASI